MRFSEHRKVITGKPLIYQFMDKKTKNAFKELARHLIDFVQKVHAEKDLHNFKANVNAAAISPSELNTKVRKDQ